MQQKIANTQPQPNGGYKTRPGVVTLVCVWSFIGLGWHTLLLILFSVGRLDLGNIDQVLIFFFSATIIAVYSVVLFGLWQAKNWARISFVVVFPLFAILGLAADPIIVDIIRLPILVVFCFMLYRPRSSAYFSGMALPPIDPASGLEIGAREIVHCPTCDKELYSTLSRCHHCGADMLQLQVTTAAST